METAATTEQTAKEKIAAAMAKLGLSITSEFVPFSQSRNAKPGDDGKIWRSLNWRVTLKRHLRVQTRDAIDAARLILTTDYGSGVAACEAYKASIKMLGHANSVLRDEAIKAEIETGRKWSALGATRHIHEPDACDVIASLVMDSSVIDCGSFEEWASDAGYDTDSRKAEAAYRACLEIALKLRNGLGEDGLAKLREACEDY